MNQLDPLLQDKTTFAEAPHAYSTPQTSFSDRKRSSNSLSLRVNFSWTLAGNVIYAVFQWAMFTAIAKCVTPEMVGRFALGLALTAPVIMFTNLQLRAILATDARRVYQFRDYLSLRFLTTSLAGLIIVVISFAGGYRKDAQAVILLIGLAKSIEALSDVFYGRFQQHERMDMVAKRIILKGLLGLAFLTGLLVLTDNVIAGVLGLLVANALSLFGYDIRSGPLSDEGSWKIGFNWLSLGEFRNRWHSLIRLAWTALPLGLVMMLISLNTNVPRYFLERRLGERDLGIFAALAYLMVAGATVTNALGQSAIPRLAIHYEQRDTRAYKSLLLKMVKIGTILGILAIVLAIFGGRMILTLLYRPEYALHTDLLIWLMVVGGIQIVASFLGYGMTAARRFNAQLPLFLAVTGTSILASMMLIPVYGVKGAAIALLVSSLVQLFGSAVIVWHAVRTSEATMPGLQ